MKEAAANILYDQLQLTTCLLQLRHLGGSRVYFLCVAVDRHCRFRSARLKKTILKRVSHEVIFSDIQIAIPEDLHRKELSMGKINNRPP